MPFLLLFPLLLQALPHMGSKLISRGQPLPSGLFRALKQNNSNPFRLTFKVLHNVVLNLPFQPFPSLCYLPAKDTSTLYLHWTKSWPQMTPISMPSYQSSSWLEYLVGIPDSYFCLLKFYSSFNAQLKYLLLKEPSSVPPIQSRFPLWCSYQNTFWSNYGQLFTYLSPTQVQMNPSFRAKIGSSSACSCQCLELGLEYSKCSRRRLSGLA